LTKAFDHTVCDREHQDVVSSGILADKFGDKGPREWTKQALKTCEKATGSHIVDIIAESSF